MSIARWVHLIPSRTQKLSAFASMILLVGKVERCQHPVYETKTPLGGVFVTFCNKFLTILVFLSGFFSHILAISYSVASMASPMMSTTIPGPGNTKSAIPIASTVKPAMDIITRRICLFTCSMFLILAYD